MQDGTPERYALVICDTQPDLLASLEEETRSALLTQMKELLQGARRANWFIVFSGTRFQSGYEGVSTRHRLFGGMRRLNTKVGDEKMHALMEGYEGAEIHPSLAPLEDEVVVWRQRLCPSTELLEALRQRGITKVVLAGLKTAQGVLATCEALADEGHLVYVVRECVADSDEARGRAVLDHVLCQYADVLNAEAFREQISQELMMDMFIAFKIAKRAG